MNRRAVHKKRISLKREKLRIKYTGMIKPVANILQGMTRRSKELKHVRKLTTKTKIQRFIQSFIKLKSIGSAYRNIKSNAGSMISGVSTETIDGMSLMKIKRIAKKIKEGRFKFSRVRRKWIVKQKLYKKGQKVKLRPLGIPNFTDRLVQEAIRIILEAIYEPYFEDSDSNYGFRPSKGAHHAMKKIKFLGSNCTTVIEGDIEGAYDNVDHDVLANILRKRISDERFIDLLKSGFKSGILDQGKNYDTLTGVPQGGIASPILFNIYMQEFDEYINHELQKDLDFLNDFQKRSTRPMNKEYNKVENRLNYIRRKYKQWKNNRKYIELNETEKVIDQKYRDEMKMLIKRRAKLPSILAHKRSLKILYVRYADDWLL